MNIILTENIEGLGIIGDMIKVKPGYARNYLVPRGLALEASTRNIRELEHQKRQMDRKRQLVMQEAEALKSRIEGVTCTFAHRASEEGKLFGAVTAIEVADKLAASGIEIDRKKLKLAEPIKTLGEHQVPLRLQGGIVATIKVQVVPAE